MSSGKMVKRLTKKESVQPITAEYLVKLHPELSLTEAENLKRFSIAKGIHLKMCYGTGAYMLPMWKEQQISTKESPND